MNAWLWGAWSAIWPNLVASAIWAAPAFVAHHLLLRRHIDRRHEQLTKNIADRTEGAPQ